MMMMMMMMVIIIIKIKERQHSCNIVFPREWFVSGICVWIRCIKEEMMITLIIIIMTG
jgi:hypothetical protein